MRKQYSDLQERSASAQTQMERTQHLLDRIRHENSRKSTEMDKLQHEFNSLGDRLRVLENKAMEVEKMEITLDQLKKLLETSQQEVRDNERQTHRLERLLDEKEKIITSREHRLLCLEESNADLKLQVREEVIKNTNLEMRIENTEKLKEELVSQKLEIELLHKQLAEGRLLTQHARQCLREERLKRQELEREEHDLEGMRSQVEFFTSENTTLKRLLAAKQILCTQKTNTVNQLKSTLEEHVTPRQYREIVHSLEKQQTITRHEEPFNGETYHAHQAINEKHQSNGKHRNADHSRTKSTRLLQTILNEDSRETSPHNSTETAAVNARVYQDSFSNFRTDSPTFSDVTPINSNADSTFHSSSGLHRTRSLRQASISGSRSSTTSSIECINGRDRRHFGGIQGERRLKSERRISTLAVGDRVIIDISKKGAVVYSSGVVKYLGRPDSDKASYKLFAGIKLDKPDGDTDGIYKGNRHFRVSPKHGKFVRIERVLSVFDEQTGRFINIKEGTSHRKDSAQ